MSRKHWLVLPLIAVALVAGVMLLAPRHAYAACNGCTPTVDPSTLVCTSSCNSEGYQISVIKQINGGPSLPPECSLHGVSAAMQYIVLERIPQVRNYSQTEYPGISSNPNFHISNVVPHTPGPNDMVCDVHGNALTNGTYYTVTFSLLQGVVACYPAREDTIDCGDYNTMAHRYDGHAHTSIPNQLQPCRDDCNEVSEGGSGGSQWGHAPPHGGVEAQYEGEDHGAEIKGHAGSGGGGTGTAVTHTKIPGTTGGVIPHTTTHATTIPVPNTTTVDAERQACVRKGGTASMTTGKVVCILPQPKTTPHTGLPDTKGTAIPRGTPGKH